MPWRANATAMIFAYETGDRLAKKTATKWHHVPPPLLMERKNSTQLNTYRTKKKNNEENVWEKLVKQDEINPNEVNRTKIAKNYSQAVMCAKLVSYQDSSVYYEYNTYTLDDWYRLCNTVVMWNFLI